MNISPEIIGAIIGFLGAALIAYLTFYFTTHSGSKVVLRKVNETSLLNISNLISDKLSIAYMGRKVDKLKLYEFEITNDGFFDIENLEVEMVIVPKGNANIVEIITNDSNNKTEVDTNREVYHYLIKRPFLNMKKKNKEEKILIQIFTDSELEIKIFGGGKGWGVKYLEKRFFETFYYQVYILFTLGALISTSSFLIGIIGEKVFAIGLSSSVTLLVIYALINLNDNSRKTQK